MSEKQFSNPADMLLQSRDKQIAALRAEVGELKRKAATEEIQEVLDFLEQEFPASTKGNGDRRIYKIYHTIKEKWTKKETL